MPDHATGYSPSFRPKWRWVTRDEDDDGEGEPLKVEIRRNLSFGEIEEINTFGRLTFTELWAVMAPHVRAWNVKALDVATGDYYDVQPPAQLGPNQFTFLEPDASFWIAQRLRTAHVADPDLGKGKRGPDSTDESTDEED